MNGSSPLDETAAGAASSRFALITLFLVVTLNLYDRQLVNILAQDIKLDMHLSDAELGLLTGTAFGLLKAAFSIPVGAWADRGNRPRILAGLVALFSVFTFACAVASNFAGLALARMGVGIGESATVPVVTAMVRDRFPRRSTSALAVAMAGNPTGSFLAFLVGGMIAHRWGWRCAFLVAGPPGLLLACLVFAKLGDKEKAQAPVIGRGWFGNAAGLFKRPRVKPLIFATVGSMFMVSAASSWMPAYLIRTHGLTTAQAGFYVAIAVGIGGAIGALSGVICDFVQHRIRNPESVVMRITLLLAAPFLLAMIFATSTAAAVAAFFVYNILAYAWLGPTIRLIQDAVEPHQRSVAMALCSAVAIAAGLGIGVPLVGLISDILTPAYGARALGIALCSVVLVAVTTSLTSHLIIARSVQSQVPIVRF